MPHILMCACFNGEVLLLGNTTNGHAHRGEVAHAGKERVGYLSEKCTLKRSSTRSSPTSSPSTFRTVTSLVPSKPNICASSLLILRGPPIPCDMHMTHCTHDEGRHILIRYDSSHTTCLDILRKLFHLQDQRQPEQIDHNIMQNFQVKGQPQLVTTFSWSHMLTCWHSFLLHQELISQ